jgi:hypothetical protein
MNIPSRIRNAINETKVRIVRDLRQASPVFTAAYEGSTPQQTAQERTIIMTALLDQPDLQQILCSHVVGLLGKLRAEGWDDDQIANGINELATPV